MTFDLEIKRSRDKIKIWKEKIGKKKSKLYLEAKTVRKSINVLKCEYHCAFNQVSKFECHQFIFSYFQIQLFYHLSICTTYLYSEADVNFYQNDLDLASDVLHRTSRSSSVITVTGLVILATFQFVHLF